MKKIIATLALVCVVAAGAFAQTTADEWFKKAGEYFDKGDYANAVTAYSETIKRGSSNLDAYYYRSYAYFQVKNYDAAIADCDTVIKGAPDFPNVYAVRGDAYGAKGVYHKAVADYRIALEKGLDPNKFNVDKSSNASMWFCGAMYMEIAVNRFLGKSDVVTKNENWLKTVCDKNKVTRAEIEKFYRDNVRGLVSNIVDEQLANLKGQGAANTSAGVLVEIKNSITSFMLDPNTSTYNNLLLTYRRSFADGGSLVMGFAVGEINAEISIALANNKILTGAR
jgi:tetratricopeptide (TPR) repeat protein